MGSSVSESSRSVSGILRATLGIQLGLSKLRLWLKHRVLPSIAERGPKGQKKKKTWGGTKTCSVKRACEGARKRPPPLTKGPGR